MFVKLFIYLSLTFVYLYSNSGILMPIKGKVSLIRDSNHLEVVSKKVLQEGDIIETFNNSVAKLHFRDNTQITIGKNSKFAINEYLYQDKKTKADFSVLQGSFKAITGKISKLAPDKFKLKLKSASIGIRGTEFYGATTSKDTEKIFCTKGAISVQSKNKFNLSAGFMTTNTNGTLSKPEKFDNKAIEIFEQENFNLNNTTIYTDTTSANVEQNGISNTTVQTNETDGSTGNGKGSNIIIDSNVKNIQNIVNGSNNSSEQNIHSTIISNRGEVEYIYIKGKAEDVSTVISGSNNAVKTSIGTVDVE